MPVKKLRQFVKEETLQIHLPQPLLECARDMGNNLHDLGDKGLIGREFGVPVLDELPQDNGNKGVELKIHIIAAGQGRQQVFNRYRRALSLVGLLLGAENTADEKRRRLV
jgi:hypothetical protein